MKNYKAPCNIGDTVYTIKGLPECFNHPDSSFYQDYLEKKERSYRGYLIEPHTVEGFIIDESGIHIAENNAPDGWVRLVTYNSCQMFEAVYFSYSEAKEAIDDSHSKPNDEELGD